MKTVTMAATLVVALAGAATALADDRGYDRRDDQGMRDERGGNDRGPGYDDRGGNDRGPMHDERGGPHGRWADDNGPRQFDAPEPYHHPRGYRKGHHWGAGERLPKAYLANRYYVDYRQYNLQPPPAGHQWVRVDNDFVLTAIATGVVVDVLQDVLR